MRFFSRVPCLLLFSTLLFYVFTHLVWALGENQPIHFSADRQVWDRKANIVELYGHAAVNQVGETLTADFIRLDLNARVLDAKSNCIYLASGTIVWGDEMHFNLDTRTGIIVAGRVSNDRFTLRGDRINKLGVGRFQTHWGNYTTCRDCAPSWNLEAQDVDMETDGYAYLSNVTTRIKDAPAFWLPYLIVPMKTRRQTGFLFPRFSVSGPNGASFILPFFWAINPSSDMTLGLGEFSQRGHRVEWEGRQMFSPRSGITATYFFLTDKTFVISPRWALNIAQMHELPWKIDEKFVFTEVSDNFYPFNFGTDVPPGASGEAFIPSSLIFSRGSSDVSAFLSFQRYRNVLNSTPGDSLAQQVQFDPRTVQVYPSVVVTTNDKSLFGTSLFGGLTVGLTNFTRAAGAFDYDNSNVPFGTPVPAAPPPYTPGIDPLRQATRISVTPLVYTTLRPFDLLSLIPSLQYRGYYYNFGPIVPDLNRGYLLFQVDLTAQLERIYDFPDDKEVSRSKHLIRPLFTYSNIPYIREPNHPFINQIQYAQQNGTYGYNFDDNDIVPVTVSQNNANYFVPQGSSLAYGLTSQWIRKKRNPKSNDLLYQTAVEVTAGQAINFVELTDPVDSNNPRVFGRFFSTLGLNYDNWNSATTYYYYTDSPTLPRHTISTTVTLIFERSFHQRLLTFDRSLSLGYTYSQIGGNTNNLTGSFSFSITDYLLPSASISYQIDPSQIINAAAGLQIQSPSQCWKLITGLKYDVNSTGLTWGVDFSFNLTGGGFGGVTDLASQVVSH